MPKKQLIIINNHILSIIWLLFLILPNNQLFFFFVPLAYIVLFNFKSEVKLDVTPFILGFVFLIIIIFIINLNELYINNNIKDINRLAVLALLFIAFGRVRGNAILKPYIYIAIGYLVLSQFTYILNITPLKLLFSIYTDNKGFDLEEKNEGITIVDYGISTLGGIFFNQNQYARYLELIMLVLMCEIKQFSKKSLMILFPVIIFSLGAAGSRTSLIVFCLAVIFYWNSAKVFSPQKTRIISILFIILFFFVYLFTDLSEMRVFKINEGMDNSFGIKVRLLMMYIDSNLNMIKILFGNGTPDAIRAITGTIGTDWEIGNLFLMYGILFFIFLFLFYFYLFKRYLPKYRVIFTILFWMFSSSIISSYRMAALWMLVLGLYYHRSLAEKIIT